MNRENFKIVLDKIESDPSCWKQSLWHCGTKHCFAGWAQILSGNKPNEETVRRDATRFLDVLWVEASYLFNPRRTLEDFREFLKYEEESEAFREFLMGDLDGA